MKVVYALLFALSLVPAMALALPVSTIKVEPCVEITSDLQSNVVTTIDKQCMGFYEHPEKDNSK